MSHTTEIDVGWNTMDDTGLPWTFASEALDPSRSMAGAFVNAGRHIAIAVVESGTAMGTEWYTFECSGPISDSHLLHAPAS